MSKKTKAEKHARKLAASRKSRRGAHQRSTAKLRRNQIRPYELAALSSSPQDFRFARGLLHILTGLQDIGVLPPDLWDRFGPSTFLAPSGVNPDTILSMKDKTKHHPKHQDEPEQPVRQEPVPPADDPSTPPPQPPGDPGPPEA